MARPLSKLAPDWWDYTTLDPQILKDAAKLTVRQIERLSRPGFRVVLYDTLEDFYLAEALEYIQAWRQSTADNPCGICGPIGPTEQLPLVARLVNELNLDVRDAHFWGMDEWVEDGSPVPTDHPLMLRPDSPQTAHAEGSPAFSDGRPRRLFRVVRCDSLRGDAGRARGCQALGV